MNVLIHSHSLVFHSTALSRVAAEKVLFSFILTSCIIIITGREVLLTSHTAMIVWCIFVLILSIIVWDYFARDHRKVKLAKQFKGPLAIPLLGNFYMYLDKKPEGNAMLVKFICSWFSGKNL
jgi:hypothetical protein